VVLCFIKIWGDCAVDPVTWNEEEVVVAVWWRRPVSKIATAIF